MPFDDDSTVGRAANRVEGVLTRQVGPLPVWADGLVLVGGIGLFLIIRKRLEGSAPSAHGQALPPAAAAPQPSGAPSTGANTAPPPLNNAPAAPAPQSNTDAFTQAFANVTAQIAALAQQVASVARPPAPAAVPAAAPPAPTVPPSVSTPGSGMGAQASASRVATYTYNGQQLTAQQVADQIIAGAPAGQQQSYATYFQEHGIAY